MRRSAHRRAEKSPTHSFATLLARAAIEALESRRLLSILWPAGAETQVNTYTPDTQSSPSIAVDSSGNFVIAWSSNNQDGDGAGVHAQRFNAADIAQGGEFHVGNRTTGFQGRASVAADSAGDFVITWQSGGEGIRAQRYDPLGNQIGAEIAVANSPATSAGTDFPEVALRSGGSFLVTWVDYHQGIFGREFDTAGAPLGDAFVVNTTTAGWYKWVDLAMDADGDYAITWAEQGNDGTYSVFARRFSAADAPLGNDFPVSTLHDNQQLPAVAMDAAGNFAIAWRYGPFDTYKMRLQRFDSGGAPIGSAVDVTSADIGVAALAMDAEGDLAVAWTTYGWLDGGQTSVFVRCFDPTGAPVGDTFHVASAYVQLESGPSIAIKNQGEIVLAWDGADNMISSGVRSQRILVVPDSETAVVAGRAWNDVNGNGVQDAGETGLSGVTVDLYNASQSWAAQTITDASGNYSLKIPARTEAYLHFTAPTGYVATRVDHGIDDALDSDADRVTGLVPNFSIATAGQVDDTIDAGFLLPSMIGGTIWNDRSGNGLKDGGDDGIAGFRVFVDFNGNGIQDPDEPSGLSGVDGRYSIKSIAGTYAVILSDQVDWVESGPIIVTAPPDSTATDFLVQTSVHDTQLWQGVPDFGVDVQFNVTQENPRVAMTPDGRSVVVWDDDGNGIYAQPIDASGAAVGGTIKINSGIGRFVDRPVVAIDAAGNFVVAWTEETLRPGESVFDQDVYARRFSFAGVPQGDEFLVGAHTTGSQFSPAVAFDGSGRFIIAWADSTATPSARARLYDSNGIPRGDELGLGSGPPAIAMRPDGEFVAGWFEFVPNGPGTFFARHFDANGNPNSEEVVVTSEEPASDSIGGRIPIADIRTFPQIAMDQDGDFVVTWMVDEFDPSIHILARRFDSSMAPQGGEFEVANVTGYFPSLICSTAMDADGDFVITWAGYQGFLFPRQLYAQRYNKAGVRQGTTFGVSAFTSTNSDSPAIAMSPDGEFIVAWSGYGGSGGGIYARKFRAYSPDQTATVGDFVWDDQNYNGIQDPGEPGLAGVAVQLFNASTKSLFSSTVTDSSGHYSFDVPAGEEAYLRFISPAGRYPTQPNRGGDDSLDSDIATVSAQTPVFSFANIGDVDQDLDAGFIVPSSVSGTVFNDRNGNGTRDGAEEGLAGFVLFVDYNGNGSNDLDEPTAVTAADGTFVMPNVQAGTFNVRIVDQDAWTEPPAVSVTVPPDRGGISFGVHTSAKETGAAAQGSEFRSNVFTTGRQFQTAVAIDSAGDYVIVWNSEGQDGSNYGVYARLYNAAGVPIGGEIHVSETTSGSQYRPAVAMDANGDFVVTWSGDAQDTGNSYSVVDIYARRFRADGVPLSSEFVVNSYTTNGQAGSSIAMDGRGNFIITWQSYLQAGDSTDIFARQFDSSGTPVGPDFLVDTSITGSQYLPRVAADNAGNFAIVWLSVGQDGSGYGVFGQRFDSSGARQGAEFQVNYYTTGDQTDAAIAMDGSGTFVVTWDSPGQDGNGVGTFARRYNSVGIPQGGEFRVNTWTTSDQGLPAVAASSDGQFIIVWRSNLQDGSSIGIFGQRYTAAGVPQGSEFRINTYTTNNQGSPAVSLNADGTFVVAWSGEGIGDTRGIFAQRFIRPPIVMAPTRRAVRANTGASVRLVDDVLA